MIGKVMRGRRVAGLLRYLFGPGRANQHSDPHLVASWDHEPVALEPELRDGRPDVRRLAGLLEDPVDALPRRPERPVWHCAVRAAPTDKRLTDAEWQAVAEDVLHRTGLAPSGDDDACRWVAVRHADDHIHVVATLARQDGRPARTSNDFYRVGEACRAAEQRLGLRATAPRDRTAARRPTRGESEKATRAGRREPVRVTLAREVRTASAGAADQVDFVSRLQRAGVLVRERRSVVDPEQVTGYAVALAGDRTSGGDPVWYGGGRLAADLSWPQLQRRWNLQNPRRDAAAGAAARHVRWQHVAVTAHAAAAEVRRLAVTDPAAAADLAAATAATLDATARTVEGRRRGPLTAAADLFARAGREPYARPVEPHALGTGLRSVARVLALTGRATRDETTQVLVLVHALAELSSAVADLRRVQRRAEQARAAHAVARHLTAISRGIAAEPGAPRHVPTAAPTSAVVPRPRPAAAVHSLGRRPAAATPTRRRVPS